MRVQMLTLRQGMAADRRICHYIRQFVIVVVVCEIIKLPHPALHFVTKVFLLFGS
jgi:hypothetical protein